MIQKLLSTLWKAMFFHWKTQNIVAIDVFRNYCQTGGTRGATSAKLKKHLFLFIFIIILTSANLRKIIYIENKINYLYCPDFFLHCITIVGNKQVRKCIHEYFKYTCYNEQSKNR